MRSSLPSLRLSSSTASFARAALAATAAALFAVLAAGCDDDSGPADRSARTDFGADNSASWRPDTHRVYVPPPKKGTIEIGPPPDFSSDNDTHRTDRDRLEGSLMRSDDTMTRTRGTSGRMDGSSTLENGVPVPPTKPGGTDALVNALYPTPEPSRHIPGSPVYSRARFGTPNERRLIDAQQRRAALSAPLIVTAPTPVPLTLPPTSPPENP